MANNKDIDLYQDKEATQALISEINKVAVNGINDLSTQVADAVKQLKNVHGIENVGTINTRKYNAFFNNISTDLNDVSKKVTQNDEAIDAYSNASVGKRLLSTGAMGLFKFGEGFSRRRFR